MAIKKYVTESVFIFKIQKGIFSKTSGLYYKWQ